MVSLRIEPIRANYEHCHGPVAHAKQISDQSPAPARLKPNTAHILKRIFKSGTKQTFSAISSPHPIFRSLFGKLTYRDASAISPEWIFPWGDTGSPSLDHQKEGFPRRLSLLEDFFSYIKLEALPFYVTPVVPDHPREP
jgi:hypothetical protein